MTFNNDEPDLAKTPTSIVIHFTLAAVDDTMTEGGVEALEDVDEALNY